jgi:hypothetical protein
MGELVMVEAKADVHANFRQSFWLLIEVCRIADAKNKIDRGGK